MLGCGERDRGERRFTRRKRLAYAHRISIWGVSAYEVLQWGIPLSSIPRNGPFKLLLVFILPKC